MPERNARTSGWFTIEAGAWVRGQIRREIEGGAWNRGLEVRTDESKGLLESTYRFTISGESGKVQRFIAECIQWAKDNEFEGAR